MKTNMKKIMAVVFLLAILILNVSEVSLAAEKLSINVIIKGNLLRIDEEPIIKENRIYIPIRDFAEALDFKLEWMDKQNTARLSNLETTIFIQSGREEIFLNGKSIFLDEKSFIEKGKIFIPLRAVAEVLSQNVEWDQKNKTAIVGEFTSKEYIDGSLENHYLYVNDEYEFSMKIPNELKDKLLIKEEVDGVRFYDKYNYGIEKNTGILLSIIKTTDPGILYIIPSYALKYDNGNYYIAYFASDVQYKVGDKKSTDSYMETLKLSKGFLASFDLKGIKDKAGKNYNIIREYMKEESTATWSKYYELLDFQISNYEEKVVDGNVEATFFYKIIEKNYDKDPDKVEFIKKAKESGDKLYQTYYDEYLQPRESNFDLKIIIDKDDKITLYSNVSPKCIEWEETKMTDYIIK